MNKNSIRTRNYGTVVYPDSAPADWQDILAQQFIPALISPLHDKDTNPDNDEPKKAHYHVMVMFDNVKTKEQAIELFSKIGGVGCEVIQSRRGYARYMCHMDNPEKAQYKQDDVRALGGADYVDIIGLALDKYKAVSEMMDYCDSNNIVSYYELANYARAERFDWFRILCDSGTVVIKEYLKSRKWTIDNSYKEIYKGDED